MGLSSEQRSGQTGHIMARVMARDVCVAPSGLISMLAANPGLEPARSLAPLVLRDRAGSAPWAAIVAPRWGEIRYGDSANALERECV